MSPFKQVSVYRRLQGTTLVSWSLTDQFLAAYPGQYVFRVYESYSGVGDFRLVSETDQVSAEIPVEAGLAPVGVAPRISYFVRVFHPEGTWDSAPQQAIGNFGEGAAGVINSLREREEIQMRLGGTFGYLYKRRHWGIPCGGVSIVDGEVTGAVDPFTGEPLPDPDGPSPSDPDDVTPEVDCYGTEFQGGYWEPVEYCLRGSSRAKADHRRLKIDLSGGTEDGAPVTEHLRGLACPWVDTRDFWLDCDTDLRYMVKRIWTVDYQGIPFAFDPIELVLIPQDDPIYRVPRPGEIAAEDPSPVLNNPSGRNASDPLDLTQAAQHLLYLGARPLDLDSITFVIDQVAGLSVKPVVQIGTEDNLDLFFGPAALEGETNGFNQTVSEGYATLAAGKAVVLTVDTPASASVYTARVILRGTVSGEAIDVSITLASREVDLRGAAGEIELYTVPAGKSLVLETVAFTVDEVDGLTANAVARVGIDGDDDLLFGPAEVVGGGEDWYHAADDAYPALQAGQTVTFTLDQPAAAGVYKGRVIMRGALI